MTLTMENCLMGIYTPNEANKHPISAASKKALKDIKPALHSLMQMHKAGKNLQKSTTLDQRNLQHREKNSKQQRNPTLTK